MLERKKGNTMNIPRKSGYYINPLPKSEVWLGPYTKAEAVRRLRGDMIGKGTLWAIYTTGTSLVRVSY